METLKDLIDMGIREVYIKSYGYVEISMLGNTWQPFGNKAKYKRFTIEDAQGFLYNKTFWFADDEPSLNDKFILKDDKYLSISDFDLACRYSD